MGHFVSVVNIECKTGEASNFCYDPELINQKFINDTKVLF